MEYHWKHRFSYYQIVKAVFSKLCFCNIFVQSVISLRIPWILQHVIHIIFSPWCALLKNPVKYIINLFREGTHFGTLGHINSMLIKSITQNAMDKQVSIRQFPGPEHPYIAFTHKNLAVLDISRFTFCKVDYLATLACATDGCSLRGQRGRHTSTVRNVTIALMTVLL